MSELTGHYFFPRSSRFEPAQAQVKGSTLRIVGAGGAVLDGAPIRKVRVSRRMGHLVRRFGLPNGARFDAADNDAVDDFLRGARVRLGGAVIDRLERSWLSVLIAVALAVTAIYFAFVSGIPALALTLANRTPETVSVQISDHTLYLLETMSLGQSRLPAADQAKAQALFARIARTGRRGEAGYRLVFRHGGPMVGPNALALPDGTIIMTDELWPLIKRDAEIEGVFAHEISHVDRRHTLQILYRTAMLPAVIAVVTGDVSHVTSLSAVLPSLLLQAAYAREMEQQADDDAAVTLRRLGDDPSAMAGLIERIDGMLCGADKCGPSWLGSHPPTRERAERLRHPQQ